MLHSVVIRCNHDLISKMRADCRRQLIRKPLDTSTPSKSFSVDCCLMYWFKDYYSLYQFTSDVLFVYGVSLNGVTRTVLEFLTSLKDCNDHQIGFAFNKLELFIVLYNVIHFILDYMYELKTGGGCKVYIDHITIPSLNSVYRHILNNLTSNVVELVHQVDSIPVHRLDSITLYNKKINELRDQLNAEKLHSQARIRGLREAVIRQTKIYNNWIDEETQMHIERQQTLIMEMRQLHIQFRDLIVNRKPVEDSESSCSDDNQHISSEP